MTSPGPTAIILTIRSDVSFTQADYNAYKELKALWGDDNGFCRRLLVVFTFSDKNPNFTLEMVGKSSPQLGEVLSEAANVHVVVNNNATFEQNRQVAKEIVDLVNAVGKSVAFTEY